jgi:hypothetical protein
MGQVDTNTFFENFAQLVKHPAFWVVRREYEWDYLAACRNNEMLQHPYYTECASKVREVRRPPYVYKVNILSQILDVLMVERRSNLLLDKMDLELYLFGLELSKLFINRYNSVYRFIVDDGRPLHLDKTRFNKVAKEALSLMTRSNNMTVSDSIPDTYLEFYFILRGIIARYLLFEVCVPSDAEGIIRIANVLEDEIERSMKRFAFELPGGVSSNWGDATPKDMRALMCEGADYLVRNRSRMSLGGIIDVDVHYVLTLLILDVEFGTNLVSSISVESADRTRQFAQNVLNLCNKDMIIQTAVSPITLNSYKAGYDPDFHKDVVSGNLGLLLRYSVIDDAEMKSICGKYGIERVRT